MRRWGGAGIGRLVGYFVSIEYKNAKQISPWGPGRCVHQWYSASRKYGGLFWKAQAVISWTSLMTFRPCCNCSSVCPWLFKQMDFRFLSTLKDSAGANNTIILSLLQLEPYWFLKRYTSICADTKTAFFLRGPCFLKLETSFNQKQKNVSWNFALKFK